MTITDESPAPAVADAPEPGDRIEYRAVLTCKHDPCLYCRTPPHDIELRHEPFPTPKEAADHGRGMARKVYGTEHHVRVQAHTVTPWVDVDVP